MFNQSYLESLLWIFRRRLCLYVRRSRALVVATWWLLYWAMLFSYLPLCGLFYFVHLRLNLQIWVEFVAHCLLRTYLSFIEVEILLDNDLRSLISVLWLEFNLEVVIFLLFARLFRNQGNLVDMDFNNLIIDLKAFRGDWDGVLILLKCHGFSLDFGCMSVNQGSQFLNRLGWLIYHHDRRILALEHCSDTLPNLWTFGRQVLR